MQIEVAELDSMVIQVAKKYFALPADRRLRVVNQDGRAHLQRSRRLYGAIMMDAYSTGPNGSILPYHLATQEFFVLARNHLVNGGSLVYNVITDYGNGTVLPDVYATMATVFDAVYMFTAGSSGNTVLVGQKIDYASLKPNGSRDGKGWPEDPWLAHPVTASQFGALVRDLTELELFYLEGFQNRIQQLRRAPRKGRVLTDDYAPVDTTRRR